MTQVAVDSVRQGCQALVPAILTKFKEEIMDRVSMNANININMEDEIENHIDDAMDNFPDPFNQTGVAHKDERFMKEHYNYITAREILLGSTVSLAYRGRKRKLVEFEHKMYYIPIKESVQQFLSNDIIYNMVVAENKRAPRGYIMDIYDGSIIQNNDLFRRPNSLMFQLYYDDLEYCNPLGSNSRKLGMFYYRLGNLPPMYRAGLNSIRVLAIVDTTYIKKYGIDTILAPFMQDLVNLNSHGWQLNINGRNVLFHGGLQCVIGDTPAVNSMAGFKESVSFAFDKCRLCQCTSDLMQTQFRENLFHPMTLTQYLQKCSIIEECNTNEAREKFKTLYGINRRSVLTQAPMFNLVEMMPFDNMHVLIEGIAQFELKQFLKFCILEPSMFTVNDFNSNMEKYFAQFRYESMKAPTPITLANLHSNDNLLRQTCSKMNNLMNAMPFILYGLIDFESDLFLFVKQLLQISNMIFATVISVETLSELTRLIKTHYELFKNLFPDINLIPKQHFLLHVPSITKRMGPSEMYNCDHFEQNHKGFKRKVYIRQNYKNVAKSVLKIALREECLANAVENPKMHPMFANNVHLGKSDLVSNDVSNYVKGKLEVFCNIARDTVNVIYSTKSMSIGGYSYVTDYTFLAVEALEYDLVFALLKKIYIVNGRYYFFELQFYNTLGFDENFQSFAIELPEIAEATVLKSPDKLIDFKPYFLRRVDDDLFIQIHSDYFDLLTLSREHPGVYNDIKSRFL